MFQNLVLSGGAFKSVMFVGAIRYLEEKDLVAPIKCVIGSSAGSVIGLMVCLGFTSSHMETFLKNEIEIYKNDTNFDVESILDALDTLGVSDGKEFEALVDRIFDAASIDKGITFIDFAKRSGKNFVVCVSNLTTATSDFFCVENTPNASVGRAIRASISLPLLLTPVTDLLNNNIYVDGGLFNNFPIDFFKNHMPFCDTLSLLIPMKLESIDISDLNIFTYTKHVFDTLLYNHNVCKLDAVHKSNVVVYLEKEMEDGSYNGIDLDNIGKVTVSAEHCDPMISYGYEKLRDSLVDPSL